MEGKLLATVAESCSRGRCAAASNMRPFAHAVYANSSRASSIVMFLLLPSAIQPRPGPPCAAAGSGSRSRSGGFGLASTRRSRQPLGVPEGTRRPSLSRGPAAPGDAQGAPLGAAQHLAQEHDLPDVVG